MQIRILFIISIIIFLPPLVFSSEADLRFVDGLVSRQMFETVELFCKTELNNTNKPLAEKYLLASQLVRSRTVQMLISGLEYRQHFLDGLAVLTAELTRLQTETFKPEDELAALLFQLQLGIAHQTAGEEQSRQLELLPPQEHLADIENSRKLLQTAIEILNTNREKIQLLRNKTAQNADLSFSQKVDAAEISYLYQTGTAQIALADTYESAERNELLKQSAATLYPIANLQNNSPVVLQCRIKLAQCYRLLNEKEKYIGLLGQLNSTKNSGDIQFQTELLRYYIFTGSTKDILPVVLKGRTDSAAYPEYDLARIEILLHSLQSDETSDEKHPSKKETEDKVLEIAALLEHEAGSYWGHRARNIIAGMSALPYMNEHGNSAGNPAMLAALAETTFFQKKYADASQLFEQAEKAAQLNGNIEDAFRYGSSAAGVLYSESENNADNRKIIIEKLRAFALRYFARKEASEYHLKAIDLASQEVAASRMTLDNYITLLQEYTATWAASPKTPPLLLRTAVLLTKQNKAAEALTIMEKFPNLREKFIQQLSETERQQIDYESARYAAKNGKTQESVNLLTELLKKQPENINNWILLAEILSEQSDETALQKALQIWTKIERQSKDGTENWWTAREKIITILVKLNRKGEAVKAFELLKTLHPDIDKKRETKIKNML